jgi:ATP synthase protein I
LSNHVLKVIRNVAFSYIYIQTLVILILSVSLYFLGNKIVAFSFLWGGAICIIPNIYFAHKLFAQTGAAAARNIVASFYVSEVIKFIITIILFFIAFKYLNTNKLALFIGYIVAQVTFWFTALFRHRAVNKL